MWKVEDWYQNGNFVGWRIVRRGPRGQKDVHNKGFVYDWTIENHARDQKAAANAECDRLNEAYTAPNVVPLFG